MLKTCSDCGETRDVSCFYAESSSKDGYRNECKICKRDASRRNYKMTDEEKIMKVYEWQINNAEKVKAAKRKYKQKEKERKYENNQRNADDLTQ